MKEEACQLDCVQAVRDVAASQKKDAVRSTIIRVLLLSIINQRIRKPSEGYLLTLVEFNQQQRLIFFQLLLLHVEPSAVIELNLNTHHILPGKSPNNLADFVSVNLTYHFELLPTFRSLRICLPLLHLTHCRTSFAFWIISLSNFLIFGNFDIHRIDFDAFRLLIDIFLPCLLLFQDLLCVFLSSAFLRRLQVFSIQVWLNRMIRCLFVLLLPAFGALPSFSEPMLEVLANVGEIRQCFPGIVFVCVVFPFDEVVRLVYVCEVCTVDDGFVEDFLDFVYVAHIGQITRLIDQRPINIFIMQEKLIITLWKAQFKEVTKEDSIYCRLTYNNTDRSSKPSTQEKNLVWKETFIFPLDKKESPLKIQFIGLKQGQAIHFAKDQVLQSLSFGRSIINIPLNDKHHGSLPCKVDILDKEDETVGKIFIEYEVMKTEVAYTVEKQMDYHYLLKLTNFKLKFVRKLKNSPKFYLHFMIDGRQHKEDLPFQEEEGGIYAYNYPVKLYLKKEIQAEIQLDMKQQQENQDYPPRRADYQTESSFSESIFSEKKTFKSSVGKKQRLLLELGKQKISALFDLNFKRDTKVTRKLPLTTMIKFQKREIGVIEFQAQAFFRSKEQLQEIEEQKKGLNPQKDQKTIERKKSVVKQSNGVITINSILGKLQLFNEGIIEDKNMSLQIKLGNQIKESTVLQKPGKQLIFIDTFVFKRMWEETMKIVINLHNREHEKIPTFFTELKLRELFELGRYVSKKIKLKDEHKSYSGELIIDVQYKEVQEKRSPSIKDEMGAISEVSQEEALEMKALKKKAEIEMRMKARQQLKQKAKQLNSMSTLAVLQSNDILLPPLRSISRLTTISPKAEKFKGANMFNVNGSIKFSRSPRFEKSQRQGYQSYTFVRQSDFDARKKKGASIGRGQKYDFTKPYSLNPGVGRYQMPSVWDKYK